MLKIMATGTLAGVGEYLSTSYRPDREYIDGVIVERNLGESDHSNLQTALAMFFFARQREWHLRAVVEQRVQVKPTRFRIPDVSVVLGRDPLPPILTSPPFLCIEVLSKDDTVDSVQDRVDDYLAFGVRHVWVINPRTRRAFVHTAEGSVEAKDGILRTQEPAWTIPLAEVFSSFE